MQTQFIGLILTYEKLAMGAFLGIIFALEFQHHCPVLCDFIHAYRFFSCYCILGDFNLQYCI